MPPVCVSDVSQFPIQNCPKQWDPSLTSLFNFALKYAFRIGKENPVEMKLNETYQLLVYGDDNLLGETKILQRKAQKRNSALVRWVV